MTYADAYTDTWQTHRETEYIHRAGQSSDIADHLPWLLAQASRRKVIAELGVRGGNSTAALLCGAGRAYGHLWSVDINPPDVPAGWHQDPIWSFAQCDSVSAQALAFIPNTLDMILIDTSHTYDQTMAELAAYGPRMRRGGLIACHDTQWDEGDISLPKPGGPVTAALDDYTLATGRTWRNRDSRPGLYGMGIIWT